MKGLDRVSSWLALTRAVEWLLAIRAIPFVGNAYICPCCGWRLRAFTMGGWSLRRRYHGYCPRCNSKARHRRLWLYLRERTDLFDGHLRLFEVSPKYSLSRRFVRMPDIEYVTGDIATRPNVAMKMDLTAAPLRSHSFDAVICQHVLEHIQDDRSAIAEIYRILRPGGWAVVSVPLRLDQPTYEDASIVTPADRKAAFGEMTHVRFYGHDLRERLADAGFLVSLDHASDVDEVKKRRYGLLDDENIFYCRKPGEGAGLLHRERHVRALP